MERGATLDSPGVGGPIPLPSGPYLRGVTMDYFPTGSFIRVLTLSGSEVSGAFQGETKRGITLKCALPRDERDHKFVFIPWRQIVNAILIERT